MAECLDYTVYVKQRMDALGLSLPSTWFDGYDQMVAKLSQLAAISTLNPTGSVLAVRGVLPILGVAAAMGASYYTGALAGSLFMAGVEGQYCRNMNQLNSHQLVTWMKSKGIYDIEGVEAELMRHPRLRLAYV